MSKYRATWHLTEFTQVFVVRYRDPLNKKRFAIPYKDQKSANDKMAQLKRDGVKEIEVTKDMLRGNIKFKEVVEDTDNEKLASLRTRQMALQTKLNDMDRGDPKNKTPMAITKNDIENIGMKMDQIKDKIKRQSMNEDETKEFEKDLAAQADLTKGQIKKVHKMADELPKKDFKDRYGKEKGDSVRYATATNIVKKKEGIKEMQQIDEKIKGISNKSEKSGIPYGILKQVYNRGMAAWKGGHRPGTTPQQWAMARVNAFITKGKAYYTADADLAKKARAAKRGK